MRPVRIAMVLLAIGTIAGGCIKARAQKPDPPMQPLATPEPPNRVIIPAVLPEPVEPPPAPAAPAPTPSRPPTSAPKPADRPSTTPPAPQTTPAEPAPTPGVVLQTRETSAPGELERQTRLQIKTATDTLAKINSTQLNANAKAQFDMARGLIRQSEAALTSKNFLVARDLADKAAVLAKELAR
jgi:hypothetical protein